MLLADSVSLGLCQTLTTASTFALELHSLRTAAAAAPAPATATATAAPQSAPPAPTPTPTPTGFLHASYAYACLTAVCCVGVATVINTAELLAKTR